MAVRIIHPKKSIALVAHDHKKDDLIRWIERHQEQLKRHNLIATGTTGTLIENLLNVSVTKVLSGPLGGDQQIGAMIAEGHIDIIVFFWDPMEAQPHDSDVKALLRLGVAWNIPMACDEATADFIISSPHMEAAYEIELPDYSRYLNRKIDI